MQQEDITKQFKEVFDDHHNPETREKKKILAVRKKRAETIRKENE